MTPKQQLGFLCTGITFMASGGIMAVLGFWFSAFALKVLGPCMVVSGVFWVVLARLLRTKGAQTGSEASHE